MKYLTRFVVGTVTLVLLSAGLFAQSKPTSENEPVAFTLAAGQSLTFEWEIPATADRYFHFDNRGLDYFSLNINGQEIDFIIDSFYYCGEEVFCCQESACYMPDDGGGILDISQYLAAGVNEIILLAEGDTDTFAEIRFGSGGANNAREDEAVPGGPNRPPIFNVPPTPPASTTLIVDAGTLLTFTVRATDPDAADRVRLSAVGLPTGATFPAPPLANPAQGQFNWTPTAAQVGLHTVTFRAEDTRGLDAPPHRVNLRVRIPTNRPPVFVVPPTPPHESTSVVEVARLISFTARASDPDPGDTIRLRVIGLPAGATFPIPAPANPVQSVFSWTPILAQARLHTLIITATDSRGLAGRPHRLQVRVRIPARGTPFFSTPPTPPRRVPILVQPGNPVNFTVRALDPDSPDTLTLSAAGLPAGAACPIPPPANPVSCTFDWLPDATQMGSHTVTFSARDNRSLSTGPHRIRIIVRPPANRAPIFDVPPTPARASTINVQLGGTVAFMVQSSDPDGDPVTLSLRNRPAGAVFVIPPADATVSSEFRWTPTAAQVGTHALVFSATDNRGLDPTPHTLFINVSRPFNRTPQYDVPPTPPAGGRLRINFGNPLSFTVRATDADAGDRITLRVIGLPAGASFPIPAPANPISGTFAWTPTAPQIGSHMVTFGIRDDAGSLEVFHAVNIVVGPLPNNPPSFDAPPTPPRQPPIKLFPGERLSFSVRASDLLDDDDTITLSVTGLPAGATFPLPPPANPVQSELAWTPTTGQIGTHTLTFRALDNRGAERPHPITIVVEAVPNRAPMFNTPPTPPSVDPLVVFPDSTINFTVRSSDPNAADQVTLGVMGLPTGASFPIPPAANPVSSDFSWTPGFEHIGTHTLTFTARDNRGLAANPHPVRIIVRSPSNRPPVFAVPPTPARGSTLTVRVGALLSFMVQAGDPDFDDVTLSISGRPAGATFAIPPPAFEVSSEFRWTPTAGQVGSYAVVFSARDSRGLASLSHRVFIHVVR